MSETEVKVPNIGDFKDVEVIEVLVSEGQILKKNDPLITIESDKSSVEIPSNFEGKIKSLRTKVGDKVSEGDLILILDSKSQLNEIAISFNCDLLSKINIKSPSETLSPTFVLKDLILPSKFDGISTLDLSLSIVIKGSFFLSIWPSETSTSITSTSLKSPIFGTLTSVSDIII